MVNSSPALPLTPMTTLPPSLISTVTSPPAPASVGWTVTRTAEPSTSGTIFTSWMLAAATGSSHTVCQMPVVGVYMMPPGCVVCLPRGCPPPSVGSYTRTMSSCSPPPASSGVTS